MVLLAGILCSGHNCYVVNLSTLRVQSWDSGRDIDWPEPLAGIKEADISAKRFDYNELRVATRNFAPEMKLGAGAYGAVYKVRSYSDSHESCFYFCPAER
jgi:hypothetical protein